MTEEVPEDEIAEAESRLKAAEAEHGASSIQVADNLLLLAGLLKSKGGRALDAMNLEARAKVIKAKIEAASDVRKCPYCAETIKKQAIKCRFCGSVLSQSSSKQVTASAQQNDSGDLIRVSAEDARDPLLMAFWSGCCIAGMGQMLLGQVAKGFAILAGSIALGFLTWGISCFFTWTLSAVDAYCIAEKLKKGRAVGKWEWF